MAHLPGHELTADARGRPRCECGVRPENARALGNNLALIEKWHRLHLTHIAGAS